MKKFSQVVEQCRSGASRALTFCLELAQIYYLYMLTACHFIFGEISNEYVFHHYSHRYNHRQMGGVVDKKIMFLQLLLTPRVRVDGVDQKTSLCKSLKKTISIQCSTFEV